MIFMDFDFHRNDDRLVPPWFSSGWRAGWQGVPDTGVRWYDGKMPEWREWTGVVRWRAVESVFTALYGIVFSGVAELWRCRWWRPQQSM